MMTFNEELELTIRERLTELEKEASKLQRALNILSEGKTEMEVQPRKRRGRPPGTGKARRVQ